MRRTHQNDQAGMVAIIITMIMIFIITLIVLGFSEVTRRNQREALDTQLAAQAYYAAETGVNDVVNIYKAGNTVLPQSTCVPFTIAGKTYPRSLKSDNSVATTCLMVDPYPTSLIVDTIKPSTDSVVWDVKNASGATFSSFKFTWSADPTSTATGSCNTATNNYIIPSLWSTSCKYALVRVDLVPAGTSLDAVSLTNANKTFYLKPSSTTTTPTLGAPAAYQAGCKPTGGTCSVQVNVSSSEYYMRITSQYATAKNLILTATEGASTPATFSNGQVVVDSTGRAQDQVKRIRVRVPLGQSANLPVFALQSADTICKNLKLNTIIPYYTADQCKSPVWPGANN